MPSAYWDESLASRYRQFQYAFSERSLHGCTVVLAGATGGLGAATVSLLAREGARLIVGYRSNRDRAEALRTAIPRFGHPEDIARAVRFFLEPDNYITGQTLLVDGGLTLRRDRAAK